LYLLEDVIEEVLENVEQLVSLVFFIWNLVEALERSFELEAELADLLLGQAVSLRKLLLAFLHEPKDVAHELARNHQARGDGLVGVLNTLGHRHQDLRRDALRRGDRRQAVVAHHTVICVVGRAASLDEVALLR